MEDAVSADDPPARLSAWQVRYSRSAWAWPGVAWVRVLFESRPGQSCGSGLAAVSTPSCGRQASILRFECGEVRLRTGNVYKPSSPPKQVCSESL